MDNPSDRKLAEFETWLISDAGKKARFDVNPLSLSVGKFAKAAWLAALATQAEREAALIRERDILKSSVETYIRLVSGLEHGQAERENAAVAAALGEAAKLCFHNIVARDAYHIQQDILALITPEQESSDAAKNAGKRGRA